MSPSIDFLLSGINGNRVSDVHSLKKRVDGFGTRVIHVGSEPNRETGAVIPPISLSTTYRQDAIGIHRVRPLFDSLS